MEIIQHEAIVRQAYKDSVGVWTWGIGVTSGSGHKVERYIGQPQPMKKVLAVYVWLLEDRYAPAVMRAFAGHDLTEAQFAAALSFHWNTGAIGSASWVQQYKSGNISGAKKAFMNWKKPPEIITRRKSERDLFFDGKWTGNGTAAEYTQVRSSGSIVWGSRKNVDISRSLKLALSHTPALDHVKSTPAQPPNLKTHTSAPLTTITGVTAAVVASAGAYMSGVICNWPWLAKLFNASCGG